MLISSFVLELSSCNLKPPVCLLLHWVSRGEMSSQPNYLAVWATRHPELVEGLVAWAWPSCVESLPTATLQGILRIGPQMLQTVQSQVLCFCFSFSIQEGCIWIHVDSVVEKAMATHSSTLAWQIPWMEEPGGRQSMGSLGVGHDWATSLSLFTFMHWRRKWQPIPVFLPGESQGQRSLVGCCRWGRTESDTTEAT